MPYIHLDTVARLHRIINTQQIYSGVLLIPIFLGISIRLQTQRGLLSLVSISYSYELAGILIVKFLVL